MGIKAPRHAKDSPCEMLSNRGCKLEANNIKEFLVCLGHSVESGAEKTTAVPCTLITVFMLQTYIYRNTTPPRIARRNGN